MSAWTLFVLLLCARAAELRHRTPGAVRTRSVWMLGDSGHDAFGPGWTWTQPREQEGFPRCQRAWRRREHSTLDPDRFFTTPRTAPPPVNASAALLPLSSGAWTYAVLLLALVLFSVGLFPAEERVELRPHGARAVGLLVLFFCLPVILFHQLTGTRLMAALSCSLVDVCLPEPSPELPLAVLSLVLTYQEARSWWVFGCYLCLPLLFTLSCDLVTRRKPRPLCVQTGSEQPYFLSEQEAAGAGGGTSLGDPGSDWSVLRLYFPEAVSSVVLSYLPPLPVGVASALHLIGQFLLFVRCSATPLLALSFSRALNRAFVHCCCCCCHECKAPPPAATPTPSLATPSTLLATPCPLWLLPSETRPQRSSSGRPAEVYIIL
ncbi:hypothetical protein WMY93_031139 [Mugilogobius chulae]|uniref:G-protein coupled receptors family 1 profile domain-containing protein n=1 Tax=Mugilogobius chulae TaxID=88201 RepID=A0AAW0MH53_9GOBI